MFRLVSDVQMFIVFRDLYKYKSRPLTERTTLFSNCQYAQIGYAYPCTHTQARTLLIPLSICWPLLLPRLCADHTFHVNWNSLFLFVFFSSFFFILICFAEQRLNKKKSASNDQWMLLWCFHIKPVKWSPRKIQTSKIRTWANFLAPHGSKCILLLLLLFFLQCSIYT